MVSSFYFSKLKIGEISRRSLEFCSKDLKKPPIFSQISSASSENLYLFLGEEIKTTSSFSVVNIVSTTSV